jgi:hypothetical protein
MIKAYYNQITGRLYFDEHSGFPTLYFNFLNDERNSLSCNFRDDYRRDTSMKIFT